MNAVKTVGDLVIQESDVIKALSELKNDLRMRDLIAETRFQSLDSQIQSLKSNVMMGFAGLALMMFYIINRIDNISK